MSDEKLWEKKSFTSHNLQILYHQMFIQSFLATSTLYMLPLLANTLKKTHNTYVDIFVFLFKMQLFFKHKTIFLVRNTDLALKCNKLKNLIFETTLINLLTTIVSLFLYLLLHSMPCSHFMQLEWNDGNACLPTVLHNLHNLHFTSSLALHNIANIVLLSIGTNSGSVTNRNRLRVYPFTTPDQTLRKSCWASCLY